MKPAPNEREFETIFAITVKLGASGLVISSDSFFVAHIEQLAVLATRYKVPGIFGFREFPEAGGLTSYGAELKNSHRTIGI